MRLRNVTDATVTIDAMGCQTAIAAQIVAQGADYALALKDNHPTLHAEVLEEFAAARASGFADYAPADHDHWRTAEKNHGRLEKRRYWTIRDPALIAHLNQGDVWAGLRAIGLVEREHRVGTTVTVEVRHYLLSGAGDAAAFGHAVRSHWGIENRVHWVLDAVFREDESRVRVGDGTANLAVLRHFALDLLRQERTAKGGIGTNALDESYLLTVLTGLHP